MSGTEFRLDIQGLRALAVIAVITFHYYPVLLPGGFIGVDIFFVISGFLITSILINKKTEIGYNLPDTLKYFYVSRFKRIVPAYLVMLLFVALVAAILFTQEDFKTLEDGLKKAIWFSSNYYFAANGDYFAPESYERPLLHTWSLAVEVQFYLIIPFLVLSIPTKAIKWLCGSLLVGFTLIAQYRIQVQGVEQETYYSLYARIPEFFAGVLSALYVKNSTAKNAGSSRQTYLGFGFILLSFVIQPKLGGFPGLGTLLPIAGSVLLLSKPTEGVFSSILCSKFLVWVGTISYSLYLWHWPLMAFFRYYTGNKLFNLGSGLAVIILTLTLSVVSYYGVELLFKSRKTRKKKIFIWGVLAIAAFGAPQTIAKVNEVFTPSSLPVEFRRYADSKTICHGIIIGECLRGDLTSDREVLVLGDSHAAMLNYFFDHVGQELGFKARIITASSCVTIPGFDYQRISEWAQQPCLDQIEAARQYINRVDKIYIAGVWNSQTKSDIFNEALVQFFHAYKEKSIVLLSQVPRFKHDVARARRFSSIGLSGDFERDFSYRIANISLSEVAESWSNVEFMSLDSLPVFENAPYYQGRLIYIDEHHLNEFGALAYATAAIDYFSIARKR